MVLDDSLSSLKNEDISPIRDFVAEVAGLYFDDKKFYFIEKRILKRIN